MNIFKLSFLQRSMNNENSKSECNCTTRYQNTVKKNTTINSSNTSDKQSSYKKQY